MVENCCGEVEAGAEVCELNLEVEATRGKGRAACPECGKTGKPVSGQTVKALLAVSLRQVDAGDFQFCATPACQVVYFRMDGKQLFTEEQVRERVYQKEPDADETLVCYCFQHTVGELRAATFEGRAAILADINLGIQAGKCACEMRNPQGSCCLGNVRELIKSRVDETGVSAG
jgi:hypothetical protein